jgi:hypothetical protein
MKLVSRASQVALAFVVATFAPLAAAERPYDRDVEKLIGDATRGLDRYASSMTNDAKGAKVTRDGVEVDVSDFMKDFRSGGRLLRDRFSSDDMAALNALDFLKKAKANDGFIQRHPGFTGGDAEWAALKPTLAGLAGAYGIDWDSDPTTWRPVRSSDKTIQSLVSGLEKQSKDLGKAVAKAGKAAKVDKKALKGLTDSIAALGGAGRAFSETFKKKQPVGGAADSFFSSLEGVESAISGLGLEGATASMLKPLTSAAKSAASALGR